MTTARLKLPEITQSQASKHLTHNEALAMLDIYAGASLNSVTTATPPSVPVEGSAFFVPEGATGDWAPNEGKIAFRFNAEWHYIDLPTGWIFEILDEERVVVARASGIADVGGAGVEFSEYGLGANAKFITLTDYNDLDQYQTGFYSVFHSDVSAVANAPAFKSATNVNAIIKLVKESDRFTVEVIETKRSDSTHHRVKVGASTWGGWRDLWAEIAAAAGSGGGSELTAAEIKTLYESNADTNAFTDAEEAAIANLGSAASRDVGTGNGNLMEVGAGGLLSNGIPVTDFNNITTDSAFLRADPSASNLPTGAGTNNWAGFHIERFDTTYFDFWAGLTENRYFARTFNNGARDWVEFLTTGNSVNALEHGVGSDDVPTVFDLTADVKTGFCKFRADYPGAPAANSGSTLWYTGTITKGTGGRVTYDFDLVTGGTPRKYIGERIGATGSIRWREVHPEVTLLIDSKDVVDMPDVTGFYAIEGSGILNFPETSGNWQFLNLNRSSTGDGKIAYCGIIALNRDTGKMYTGSYNAARAEGDKFRWFEVLTTLNHDPTTIDKSTGKAYVDVSAGDVTLTADQSNVPVIQLGGTPGTSRTLTVAPLERMWVVTNDSDGGCTLTTGAGGTVFLEAGYQYVVFGDGTGVRAAVTIAPNGLKMNGDLILPIYSTATVPDPSTRYMVAIGVTDGDSGAPCLAVSDGGSWKRVALGATISSS
ncbi:tail fiber [Alteromonas phage vB_AmaS-R9Y1]|nr:tail fiber [Alteromonas phage vB_AmaS-R9Y1]